MKILGFYARIASAMVIGLPVGAAVAQTMATPSSLPTVPSPGVADAPVVVTVVTPTSSVPRIVHLPANTVVNLVIVDPLSSKTAEIDAMFAIRLADPIMIGGVEAIPAGVTGRGQVIHAAKPGMAGRAGELIVAARYFECGTIKLPLRSFRVGARGNENVDAAFAIGAVVPLGSLFVGGSQITIESGTRGTAKLSAAVDIPVEAGMPVCASPIAPITATVLPDPVPADSISQTSQSQSK